jgi:hypothetical protein
MAKESKQNTPHVSYEVMEKAIQEGEATLAELAEKFTAGQKSMEQIQLQHISVKSKVDALNEALKKVKDLDTL